MRCFVIYDGKFMMRAGRPASFNMHYEAYVSRYLAVADEVVLMARCYPIEDDKALPVEGAGVRFFPLPLFTNELNFLWHLPRMVALFWRTIQPRDVVVLRVPSLVGIFVACVCKLKGVPFLAEVVGDPADDFSPGTSQYQSLKKRLLRPFYKWVYVASLRAVCKMADMTAYVTADTLQKRYPPAAARPTFHYTTLNLGEEAFAVDEAGENRYEGIAGRACHVVNVAMMQRLIKGQDILLEALAAWRSQGIDVHLTLVGEGSERGLLEKLAADLGVTAHVTFTGLVAEGEGVRALLAEADVLVMPSRQEGLPRAMIEAMAQGMACLGSRVGGIPELLDDSACFDVNNVASLVALGRQVLGDETWLTRQGERNKKEARKYAYSFVNKRRTACYKALRVLGKKE